MAGEIGDYCGIDFIGGGLGAVDKIDGAVLQDKDHFLVVTPTVFAPLSLDADSGAGENSPQIIAPNTNPGNKRWILKGGVFAGLRSYGVAHVGAGITRAPDGTHKLVIDDGGANVGLGIYSTGSGFIRFGDVATANVGGFSYVHATNTLSLRTAGTDKITILSGGYTGFGTSTPNAPVEVKGAKPAGNVGGFQSGMFHVTGDGDAEFSNSVITGHSAYNTNTQLWYLGSISDGNNDIAFINRQNAAIHFSTNNATRMTINVAGLVGIHELDPKKYIHITGADTGAANFDTNANAIIEDTGTSWFYFMSDIAGNAGIAFGDVDDPFIGCINYNHDGDYLRFYVNNAERMRIKSGGNLNLIGALEVDDVQVISNQGAVVADATDPATTMARLNELIARCRAHGLIATA